MAAEIIPTGLPPVLSDAPEHPGQDATPHEHARWCSAFADWCERQGEFAFEISDRASFERWLKAERIARFAASTWAERALEGA